MKKILPAAALCSLLSPPACLAGLFPPHAFSDDARGTTSASFLKTPASARFAALGYGASALRSPEAFFFNPAGSAYMPEGSGSMTLGYESLLEGSGRSAAAGLKGLKRGVLGLGALYRCDPGLRRYDIYGDAAGALDSYDAAFTGYYGTGIGLVDAGLAVKYIRSKLADRSADSAAVDLGVILNDRTDDGMRVAFFARNLGYPMKLGSERAPLPFEFGSAIGWHYVPRLGLFIDGRMPSDHSPYLILSGEYSVPFSDGASGLLLRSGLNFKNSDDLGMLGVITCGFGLRIKSAGFDYAFVPYGDLGVTHRLTASWGFGKGALPAFSGRARGKLKLRSGKDSIAVAEFEPGDGVSETLARQVTDMVEAGIMKTGGFTLVERTGADYVAAEQELYYSGLGNKERSVELARRLGARYVLYGDIVKERRGYLIMVKLALAATGRTVAAEDRTAEEDFLLPGAARELAAALSYH